MRTYQYEVVAGDDLPIKLTRRSNLGDIDMTSQKCRIAFSWPEGSYEIDETDGVDIEVETNSETTFKESLIDALIPATITRKWPRGSQTSYQVQIEDTAGISKTILSGLVKVIGSSFKEDRIDV